MDKQALVDLYVSISNIEYRLELIEKALGITDQYMYESKEDNK